MALHYVNPNDEPRECMGCLGKGRPGGDTTCDGTPRQRRRPRCSECRGTGRLGNEDGAAFEVWYDDLETAEGAPAGWYYDAPSMGDPSGPHATEAAAVAHARKAMGGRSDA